MHDYIVKSSIASKVAQKVTHIDISTSKNTKACTIMSTETTDNTLWLFTTINPFATMFVHVTFECTSGCTSERVEICVGKLQDESHTSLFSETEVIVLAQI